MVRVVVVLLVAASVAACSSSPTAPSPTASLAGVWSGTVTRAGAEPEQWRLNLQDTPQSGVSVVSGSYEVRSATSTTTGTIIGAAGGGEATLTLRPTTPPACPVASPLPAGQISLRLRLEGNRMSGEAVVTLCTGLDTAAVSLSR